MENTNQITEQRPIASVLRAMNVGDCEIFPMSQFMSVKNTQYGNMKQERMLGWRFKLEDIEGNPYEFKVTRTA